MIENALCAGIMAQGGNVIKVGIMPTPAVAILTRYFNACAGVVISASHNPYEHNGIKFFNYQGFKLPDEIENKIEKLIDSTTHYDTATIGIAQNNSDAIDIYADFVLSSADDDFDGMKLVIDCANGATSEATKKIFKFLKTENIFICNNPNGININQNCGSTSLDTLIKAVLEHKADGGIAFDGDGDRILIVDEAGEVLDGDKIMYTLAKDMKKSGTLKNNAVVATVMSNLGFFKALEEAGIDAVKTKVGDRYVIEAMKECDYVLGGEQSGHIIISDYNSTGDGLLTAMRFLSAVRRSGKTIRQCNLAYNNYPQVLINVNVSNEKKKALENDEVIMNKLKETEKKLGNNGRVLLRPSGTEALIRVMIEGKDYNEIETYANGIADMVKERLS
jgi:phosphoglucosamine mutase